MSNQRIIESIYTDGACTGNPGPGGWGIVVYFDDGSIHEMGEAFEHTTNNQMETQAAIAALQLFAQSGQVEPVTLYSDSEYLINSVTKWIHGWKKKGWKKSDGTSVQNQELLKIIDKLNTKLVKWQHVRGHAGNIGNERCDAIARSFASGKIPPLQQLSPQQLLTNCQETLTQITQRDVTKVSDYPTKSAKIAQNMLEGRTCLLEERTMEPSTGITGISVVTQEEKPPEMRILQIRNLMETLKIADEIAQKGYLITSSELADLMDVHASAVTSRGDQWRWRNWIVSRVRREGNQILWELERGDQIEKDDN